ncbi:putative quinol monooxygenase [Paraferrimonas sedimenticola]|uniref:Antibiotic biosynthesis monooxygenase n=1 Tax=Paraferrimonas sedimenticola TaxID=375674 RepID=A0AA37RXC1_9GAMM|nr:putative quinol monooxygenase [Paraferrimonas sedimenticola]GLP96362.1 antibiotic biosynthesis monooxygenase [Paraferrimonas sedimenticola]
MTQLTIVAKILAKQAHTELVKRELLRLLEPTRAEAGCINYDLHQDKDNPALFVFYENWQSRKLWRAHMESEHVAAYALATQGCVESFSLNEMIRCN